MQITVRDCVSQASLEMGLTQKPVTLAVGSPDQDVSQMVALLSSVADDVLFEEPYRTTLGDGVWLTDSSGDPVSRAMADDNIILFDGRLAINGLKFRFLKAKSLEYGEEMRDFTARLNKLAAKANGRVLDLDEDEGRVQ